VYSLRERLDLVRTSAMVPGPEANAGGDEARGVVA